MGVQERQRDRQHANVSVFARASDFLFPFSHHHQETPGQSQGFSGEAQPCWYLSLLSSVESKVALAPVAWDNVSWLQFPHLGNRDIGTALPGSTELAFVVLTQIGGGIGNELALSLRSAVGIRTATVMACSQAPIHAPYMNS